MQVFTEETRKEKLKLYTREALYVSELIRDGSTPEEISTIQAATRTEGGYLRAFPSYSLEFINAVINKEDYVEGE